MNSGVFTIPLIGRDASSDSSTDSSTEGIGSSVGVTPYIAGPENELLRPFLHLVTTRPPLFNPVTLFGPTGVGKTHLVSGLAERLKTHANEQRVALFTGADLGRSYARAVEVDSVSEWRERIRGLEWFVLDNLEELATKPAAQQELLTTIDELVMQERQVVLTTRE